MNASIIDPLISKWGSGTHTFISQYDGALVTSFMVNGVLFADSILPESEERHVTGSTVLYTPTGPRNQLLAVSDWLEWAEERKYSLASSLGVSL